MNADRTPEAWTWRSYAALLALAVAPALLAGWSEGSPATSVTAAYAGQVTITLLLLVAAVVAYVQHRLTDDPALGWLSLGAMALGARSLCVAGGMDTTGMTVERSSWLALADLVTVAALVVMTRLRWRQVDPLAIGLLMTGSLTLVYLVLPEALPTIDLGPAVTAETYLAVAAGFAFVTAHVVRVHGLAYGSRQPAAALVALSLAQVGVSQTAGLGAAQAVLVLTSIVAGVVLVGATLGRLRSTILAYLDQLCQVRDQLSTTQHDLRDERARIHEVANSIAGIASASHLIHERPGLDLSNRDRLEGMLVSESARLARVLSRPEQLPTTPADRIAVDLDLLLEPLVVAHEATGHPVSWGPSGLQTFADPDDLAEAVSILLDNARKHAPQAPVELTVRRGPGGTVQVRVADDGPGISPGLRSTVFAWGSRRTGSTGQGLGLPIAQDKVRRNGGSVALVASDRGTTFVVTLPVPTAALAPAAVAS